MSKLMNYIAGGVIALGGTLGAERVADAKPVTAQISSSTLKQKGMRRIIRQKMYGNQSITKAQWNGIAWAAERATVKFDSGCNSHVLMWDTDHMNWGRHAWKRNKRKAGDQRTTLGNRLTRIEKNINNISRKNTTVINNTTNITHPTVGGKTLNKHNNTLRTHRKVIDRHTKEIYGLQTKTSTPFEGYSEVHAGVGYLTERLDGKAFSEGPVYGAHALLRKMWSTGRLGKLELSLDGTHVDYTQTSGKADAVKVGALGLLGKRTVKGSVAYEFLAGLGASFTGAKDTYGNVGQIMLYQLVAKAAAEVGLDTEYLSLQGRLGVGGGAQILNSSDLGLNLTSPLFAADASLKATGHLGPVDLSAKVGVDYTKVKVAGSNRSRTDLYGEGCLKANVTKGLSVGACVKGGEVSGDQGSTQYIQGKGFLGWEFK